MADHGVGRVHDRDRSSLEQRRRTRGVYRVAWPTAVYFHLHACRTAPDEEQDACCAIRNENMSPLLTVALNDRR